MKEWEKRHSAAAFVKRPQEVARRLSEEKTMTKSRRAVFALILSLVLSALTLVLMLFALQPAAKGGSSAPTPSEASSDQQITLLVDDSVPQPEHSPPFEPSADQQMAITTILVDDYAQQSSQGGLIYQDFEGSTPGWPGPDCEVRFSISPPEPVHSGDQSWRIDCTEVWNYVYVQYMGGDWHTDLLGEKNDRLTFWIYALPGGDGAGTDNPVAVRFYDHDAYHTVGFEVWTTYTAHYGKWTKLTVLFDQLPNDLNLGDIDKIEFKNRWPGTYYIDDIQAVREDRIYQSFEPYKRSLSITDTDEFGWSWFYPTSTVALSEGDDPVYEGEHSWKLIVGQNMHGTGIKSEQEYLFPRVVTGTQSFWHVDLDPEFNDRLSFWFYALPLNGLDNNVNVQFFDHLTHTIVISDQITVTDKVEYWTNQAAVYGQWTQITIPFSEVNRSLAPDSTSLKLNNIDKIQFQVYWPGTYYIDKIEAVGSMPEWDNSLLRDGVLKWSTGRPLDQYRLQENTVTGDLRDGNWVDVYTGTGTSYDIPHISRVWYRVRAEDVESADNEVPFVSAWSEVLEYNAPAVVINKAKLVGEQELEWTNLSQAISYEVESSPNRAGPWTQIYAGPYPIVPLTATVNTWYRVRARSGTETTAWSPAQRKPYSSTQDFLRAVGTTIREAYGAGITVTLRGVNLGGYLLIEPWMNDWSGDDPPLGDDYSIRKVLEERVEDGQLITGTQLITETYQDAFLTEADFDIIMRMSLRVVRLPLYYVDLQDEDGNPLSYGFERIDWVVNASADRGIYVLLDLHGAPGSQSIEAHTGRKNYNMLCTDTVTGTMYQTRTVELWEEIARRYKDNPAVMGYDLLNEPTGCEKTELWDLYDRLYDAIRAIDTNHIIMMEGIWDWDTLPDPKDYGWENVVYQFHYYCPGDRCSSDLPYDDYVQAHKDFINDKIDMANLYQDVYQVPAMIGEFNAYDSREAWEYYLAKFNEQGWSWTLWSYKVAPSQYHWGLLADLSHSDDDIPVFRVDSDSELARKLSEPFDTVSRYVPNYSLVGIVRRACLSHAVYLPIVLKR